MVSIEKVDVAWTWVDFAAEAAIVDEVMDVVEEFVAVVDAVATVIVDVPEKVLADAAFEMGVVVAAVEANVEVLIDVDAEAKVVDVAVV